MGGRAAEIVFYGKDDGLSTGASGDLQTATELAGRLLCKYGMSEQFGMAVIDRADGNVAEQLQTHVNDILRTELSEAIRQINDNRRAMDALVSALLKNNSLNQSGIEKILADVIA